MILIKCLKGILLLAVFLVGVFLYLNRSLPHDIEPAEFSCLDPAQGHFLEQTVSFNLVYGVGLTYAKHINETASEFDAYLDPPVFIKSISSITTDGSQVAIPAHDQLVKPLLQLEPAMNSLLKEKDISLHALLDYEVELAFVLLEDMPDEVFEQPDFMPKVGFFVANDLSARSIAILGEGQENRYEYWGLSKSYPGFTPVSQQIWMHDTQIPNGIPCVTLETQVDGVIHQHETTENLIYTPKQMLRFIRNKYPDNPLTAGNVVLTGTPSGVILSIPRWKARLAQLLDLDRFKKLALNQSPDKTRLFLQRGQTVEVSAEWLGQVKVTFIETAGIK